MTVAAEPFRISYVRTGGVAGLRVAGEVSSVRLDAEEAERVRRLLDEVNLDALKAAYPAPVGAVDLFQYTLTVTRAGKVHTVTCADLSVPAPLQPLFDWLRDRLPS